MLIVNGFLSLNIEWQTTHNHSKKNNASEKKTAERMLMKIRLRKEQQNHLTATKHQLHNCNFGWHAVPVQNICEKN
jgi:hypothetical protein